MWLLWLNCRWWWYHDFKVDHFFSSAQLVGYWLYFSSVCISSGKTKREKTNPFSTGNFADKHFSSRRKGFFDLLEASFSHPISNPKGRHTSGLCLFLKEIVSCAQDRTCHRLLNRIHVIYWSAEVGHFLEKYNSLFVFLNHWIAVLLGTFVAKCW